MSYLAQALFYEAIHTSSLLNLIFFHLSLFTFQPSYKTKLSPFTHGVKKY